MCKVSVLVPICNVEMYLEQCLASLAAQDMKEMEVICLNDGSKDSSSEIAHRFEKKDARFRVIDKENSGYGKTMNIGLSMAQGKYVGIVESDDFVEPDMFSALHEIAEKHNADVVKSAFWVYTNGLNIFEDVISDVWYDRVISSDDTFKVFESNPSIWSNLYKRAFLMENKIAFSESPGASFQDIAWRVKVFACARRAVFTKRAFYHYRRDNANASVRADGKLFCVCDEYDEAERFLSQRDDWDSRYQYLLPYLRYIHYHWNCFDRWLSLGKRWEFYQRFLKEFRSFDEQGIIKRSYWPRWAWFNIQEILYDSNRFFYDCYAQFIKKTILLNGFLPTISAAPRLAIYGAGKVGREVLELLCSYNNPPDCFVVAHIEDNPETVGTVPVFPIEKILSRKDDYVILIAVADSVQAEIVAALLDRGFQHIVPFLPFLRQALK